jgi:hypothetical protein
MRICALRSRPPIRFGLICAPCCYVNMAGPAKSRHWVDAPYAGHTAVIADYHKGQSLVETLLTNGIEHVALTDWKSATGDMKDLEIDNYLAEIVVAIDDLGGRVASSLCRLRTDGRGLTAQP